jgi:hypothetical protein
MIILGSVFDFAALGFGAQSIVAPLGSLTLVANVVIAPLMHGVCAPRAGVMFCGTMHVHGRVLFSWPRRRRCTGAMQWPRS